MKSIAVKSLVTLLGVFACVGLLWLLTAPTSRSALAEAGSRPGDAEFVDAGSTPTATATPFCTASWNIVASADITTGNYGLGAIAAVSANDVWAVGQGYATSGVV